MAERVNALTAEDEGKAAARAATSQGTRQEGLDPADVRQDFQQDISLKRMYAKWLLVAMSIQIGFANLGFFLYGGYNGWGIEAAVMQVWLSAAVVQVIGIVYVIARYLFPRRDQLA
jgi:hypothetical protein